MPNPAPQTLGYPPMRLRWCALALLDFLRRWAAYLLVAAAVAGAGVVGGQQVIAAVAAWFVMPLFYAASHGAWLLPALAAQVAFGTACVWAVRNLLWPPHWAEAERALPIPRALQLQSDCRVVLIALLPLLLLYAAGAVALLGHGAAWLMPVRGRACAALMLAAALTVFAGVGLLQRLRAPRRAGAQAQPVHALAPFANAPGAYRSAVRWPLAVVAWPLWRGPARRTGFAIAAGAAVLLMPAGGLSVLQQGEPWWLAAASLLALAVATRVNALARMEYAGLLDALSPLPLARTVVQRACAALGVLAVLPGVLLLGAVAQALRASALRPAMLWLWVALCLAICVVEVMSAPAAPADKAGRWLFSLVACICLATEVLA